jgi:hypothetical protein
VFAVAVLLISTVMPMEFLIALMDAQLIHLKSPQVLAAAEF